MIVQGFSTKSHNKRPSGLTHLIKNTLMQSQKKYQKKQIIEHLMAKFNSSPTRNKIISPSTHATKHYQNQKQPILLMHCQRYRTNGLLSVERQKDGSQPIRRKLLKVFSADKVSFKLNNSKLKRKGKRSNDECAPKYLESTEHSATSQSEALKEENDRIRSLCASEQQRLKQLQDQIIREKKQQNLKRFLYLQKIQKLKKIAEIEIFPNRQICNQQHEWDKLSIESLI